ncbi:MAG: hypothetical protein A3A96_02480 [Candidatus Zambryskibacteria bacterium RIFCSPLOWO2_01_FULL_39_39]|uniref:Uncharacterized protein n=1 Tax=Candidatus Zambryskibacteria bacterium RIFCSPLOWO2_01_FULL_39_39 TaxID=1802758 RepID=A0A1G2TZP2_9BACT|nr:MAG: hypothetical protein UT00_C0010G0017 [Parcubacteria group bacterium GW2011_GWA1_38_7]OHA87180.1 MAG: hypothetical protein A2644_02195 [Candidatus Zambryskibacteria bacterium RIFCSPHIGHO2_01_FULL_39_63]OHA94818.1 MAG: hypothetical protein A3B88_04240 [Candidatus Zambryskibacteria bacterium RIFCSPHIGHO2_02_FULL_39_19]OHA98308.1 MAG: hypothetical protein A3F20_01930 [Candidatus Zambryskibacteria bacterium RIFCSPHIGHO2_12_FULL_39_21]OHB02694.1 MAG: hypothetical protein A3A96_02480 [Candidat
MDQELQKLMKELGNAINDSLDPISESERIAFAIGEIRKAGYDVFLVIEATIGLNRREDTKEETPRMGPSTETSADGGKIVWTS